MLNESMTICIVELNILWNAVIGWNLQNYKDTYKDKITSLLLKLTDNTDLPTWLGNEDFHAAHRSNLLRKDHVWYGIFGWTEPDDLPYVWPVV